MGTELIMLAINSVENWALCWIYEKFEVFFSVHVVLGFVLYSVLAWLFPGLARIGDQSQGCFSYYVWSFLGTKKGQESGDYI